MHSLNSPKSKPCILVVDDNPDNITLLQTILEEEGYRVLVASSGQEALQEMRHELPNLVLLDVMMPEMDGFEVVRRIRRDRRFRSVPIVLITAYDDPFMERGWRLGADDFIRKPIEYDELMERIRNCCPADDAR
jgi:two-component system, sensor histidine kinase and response regulator